MLGTVLFAFSGDLASDEDASHTVLRDMFREYVEDLRKEATARIWPDWLACQHRRPPPNDSQKVR